MNQVCVWTLILCTLLFTCTWLYLCGRHSVSARNWFVVRFIHQSVGWLWCFPPLFALWYSDLVIAPLTAEGSQVRAGGWGEWNGVASSGPLCLFRSAPVSGVTWPFTGCGPSPCMYLYHINDLFLYLLCPFFGFSHIDKMYLSPCTLYLSFLKDILTKSTIRVCKHVFFVRRHSADWDIFQSKAWYRVVGMYYIWIGMCYI